MIINVNLILSPWSFYPSADHLELDHRLEVSEATMAYGIVFFDCPILRCSIPSVISLGKAQKSAELHDFVIERSERKLLMKTKIKGRAIKIYEIEAMPMW